MTISRILKNVTTFESDTQLFLKGLDMYNNKITRKLVLMKWTLTPPQSLHYTDTCYLCSIGLQLLFQHAIYFFLFLHELSSAWGDR